MDSSRPSKLSSFDVSSENADEKPGADQDREYGCKLCTKRFSSKQALGGHQNAHKIERAMEKSAREMQDNQFGYFAGGPSYPVPGPYLGPYNRSVFSNSPYHPSQQHGVRIGYNARPGMPLAGNYPYGPPHPVPGYNNIYSGWPGGPGPSVPQFPGHGAYVPSRGSNVRFSTPGAGGSGSGSRHIYPDLSGFREPRIAHIGNTGGGGNRNERNNPGNNDEQHEESGLDLSLKL